MRERGGCRSPVDDGLWQDLLGHKMRLSPGSSWIAVNGCLVMLAVLYSSAAFAKETLVVATYGTSLTAGGLWQPQLQQRLAQCLHRPVRVLNFGKGGTASSWGKENVQPIIAARTDVVLIEFAINDAYKPHGISLEQSYDNTRAIVHEIRGALDNAKIFLWTTNPTKETTRPDVALYYRQYERLANDLGVGMIDLYPVWLEALAGTRWRRLMPDKVHPTTYAYKQVALGPLMRAVSAGACD
jgi:acyl-CoA thioesterase-1